MISRENELLVSRLKAREPRAMEELYDRFGRLLYIQILRRVSYNDIAEDILQEVFLRIWNRICLFDETQGSFTVWMTTIARNSAIDYLRSQNTTWPERRQVDLSNRRNTEPLPENLSAEMPVYSTIEIHKALSRLTRPQRRAVELAYFEGCSHSEIALQMKRPLGTVKSIVRAALKVLRANVSPGTAATAAPSRR